MILVGAALVAGFLLRLAIGSTDDAAATDETAYLRSGLSLVHGEGFERDGQPELHFPPLVPVLLGLSSELVSDPHTGTVWVTIVAGTALIVPLALLARHLSGPTAGATTAWVAAVAPGLSTTLVNRGAGSEAVYALLVVTAVWLVVAARDEQGWRHRLRIAAAGTMVGLAYLTRPEGLLIALPLGAAVVLVAARRTDGGTTSRTSQRSPPRPTRTTSPTRTTTARLRSAVTAGLAFSLPLVACIVPYARYLHDHTGQWQLTAKAQDASLDAWHGVATGDREARDRVLYTLDDTGLQFSTDRSSLLALARDDPGDYVVILGANLRALFKHLVGFLLLSLPVWVVAGLGAWRLRRSPSTAVLLAVGAAPVATALAFFVQPRYLVVTVAVATVFVGAAVASLPSRLRRRVAFGAVVSLAVPAVLALRGPDGWWHPYEYTDMREAGEWIDAHAGPDDLVMTRSMVVQFYAERPVLAVPYADLDQILRFARHYGAQYLVADSYTITRLRPQLQPLAEADRLPGLRLVHDVEADGGRTRVFALDPPPERSDEVGPSLGFTGDG